MNSFPKDLGEARISTLNFPTSTISSNIDSKMTTFDGHAQTGFTLGDIKGSAKLFQGKCISFLLIKPI